MFVDFFFEYSFGLIALTLLNNIFLVQDFMNDGVRNSVNYLPSKTNVSVYVSL